MLTSDQQMLTSDQQMLTSDQQILTKDKNYVCQKCQKKFLSSWGFKKHQIKCKGISNILQCHYFSNHDLLLL